MVISCDCKEATLDLILLIDLIDGEICLLSSDCNILIKEINSLVDASVSFLNAHNFTQDNGKHTVCGVQHVSTTHTDVLNVQLPEMESHGSRSEQRPPGAQ